MAKHYSEAQWVDSPRRKKKKRRKGKSKRKASAPRTRRRNTNEDDGGLLIGMVVQPKTKRPVWVFQTRAGSQRFNIRDTGTGATGAGYLDSSDSPTDDYGWTAAATGYPRVHTPAGVSHSGGGYGTALYTAAALFATAYAEREVSANVGGNREPGVSSAPGNRSRTADEWWNSAVNRGLADRSEYTVESGEGEEEFEDVDVTPSGRREREILSALNENGDVDGEGGYATSIRTLTVDGTRPINNAPEDKDVDVYTFDSANKHNLVAMRIKPTESSVWEWSRDEAAATWADPTILTSLDLRGQPPQVAYAIARVALEAGAERQAVVDQLIASGHGDMIRVNPRRRRNPDEKKAAEQRLKARQARMGWDRLP